MAPRILTEGRDDGLMDTDAAIDSPISDRPQTTQLGEGKDNDDDPDHPA